MTAEVEKSILITGCSTGIGYYCALKLKKLGWRVFVTARKPEDLERLQAEGLETIYLDYTDQASIEACANHVLEATGGKLFALFNNGAYGQAGAVEDVPTEALRVQLETNVLGWHELTCHLIPAMRVNGRGRIIQNSSVLGLVAMKWRGAYSASKFAIEALSDTMRLELQGTGIHVVLIEPGPITSEFAKTAASTLKRHIDYENSHHSKSYAKHLRMLERGGTKSRVKLGPDAVCDKLIKALESPQPKAHYYVTMPTYVMAACRRLLPQRIFDRFLIFAAGKE